MSTTSVDLIVFGATGFTGRLITRYLASHPQFTQGLFSFSIAGRSQSKLHTLVQELGLPSNVNTVQVDVGDSASVELAVRSARVVLNTIGPFWTWGTPVVKACARNGVHYVDITGESVWIKDIIEQFDYLAMKTGAVIVPSCGYDSIPSDLSVFLSNKTLKAHGDYTVAKSVSAQVFNGSISGGSISTVFTHMEDVPQNKMLTSHQDYSLSPVKGESSPHFRFLYEDTIPGEAPTRGSFFVMAPANKRLVQRTFGLLELQAITASQPGLSAQASQLARRERYGPSFAYDEFLVQRSRYSAVKSSTVLLLSFSLLALFSPIRWLAKKFLPQPGSGPSEEVMQKGYFKTTNHTTSTSTDSMPPVHVKTTIRGKGDPGYDLTAIMVSESALSLLLPPTSQAGSSSKTSSLPDGLPALARKGGVLTPMTAFGEVLITRLVDSGRFTFESHIVDQRASLEARKDV